MNYWDKYSRLHDKPVTEANPIPCNNSWIYTAYYVRIYGPVVPIMQEVCFDLCSMNGKLIRSPGKALPPISHDEILGMVALGLLEPEHLKGWSFSPYAIPKFSPLKLAQQLWDLRPSLNRHRNYFWENSLDQIYRFAFSVRLVDRHFLLKTWGKFQWFNPAHLFYASIAKLDSKLGQASGIRFLKYGGKKNEVTMRTEFPEGHPLAAK